MAAVVEISDSTGQVIFTEFRNVSGFTVKPVEFVLVKVAALNRYQCCCHS